MNDEDFTEQDWRSLATLFHRGYPGYKPETLEAPNGDGKIDTQKRYLHVALKYNPPAWAERILAHAHWCACRIATAFGVPPEFYPRPEFGALRVLDYPPGAGTVEHTDFDLLTLNLWRSHPFDVQTFGPVSDTECDWAGDNLAYHIGEIGELVGLGQATSHRVPARNYRQRSLVYFAIPDHATRLPRRVVCDAQGLESTVGGETVGEWLAERLKRSRYEAK